MEAHDGQSTQNCATLAKSCEPSIATELGCLGVPVFVVTFTSITKMVISAIDWSSMPASWGK
ncbi:MAG TPA: hypothetical protein VJ280_04155 [Dehalococcoidales bacterium]|nr:hypothetical protein [Dehalococcoidales bacterium]